MSLTPASYVTPEVSSAMSAAAAANGGTDYKALICFFLFGGADTHNMVVPRTGTLLTQYEAARNSGVRIEQGELLSASPNLDWGFHPNLQNIAGYWAGQSACVIQNVGTLVRPITRDEYLADINVRPDQLFSHNTQQDIWQAALPNRVARQSGWMGRAARLIDQYYNTSATSVGAAISAGGRAKQMLGFSDNPYRLATIPISVFGGGTSHSASGYNDSRDAAYHADYRAGQTRRTIRPRNVIYQSFSDNYIVSLDFMSASNSDYAALPAEQDTAINTLTPDRDTRTNPLRGAVKAVARAINARASAGWSARRQMFFIGYGGWDNHSQLRPNMDPLVRFLDDAIGALGSWLDTYVTSTNYMIFTETEFGRTFRGNGTNGTDHGWAGHQFVLGNDCVRGIWANAPVDYTLNANRDTTQGRFIPDISIEQYYASLLRWFAIPPSVLPVILPALPNFSPDTLVGPFVYPTY